MWRIQKIRGMTENKSIWRRPQTNAGKMRQQPFHLEWQRISKGSAEDLLQQTTATSLFTQSIQLHVVYCAYKIIIIINSGLYLFGATNIASITTSVCN